MDHRHARQAETRVRVRVRACRTAAA
eukprot:COSAG01_NODE_2866_length_6949_cov_4.994599_12_plen_25_part_01